MTTLKQLRESMSNSEIRQFPGGSQYAPLPRDVVKTKADREKEYNSAWDKARADIENKKKQQDAEDKTAIEREQLRSKMRNKVSESRTLGQLRELSKDTYSSVAHAAFSRGNALHKKLSAENDPVKQKAIRDQISKQNNAVIIAGRKSLKEMKTVSSKTTRNGVPFTKSSKLKDASEPTKSTTHTASNITPPKPDGDPLE